MADRGIASQPLKLGRISKHLGKQSPVTMLVEIGPVSRHNTGALLSTVLESVKTVVG